MGSSSAVEVELVRQIAQLANLRLTPDEEPRMQRDLNAILGHVAQLNEVDTDGVEAMSQVGDVLREQVRVHGEALRGDAVRDSLDRVRVLDEAPEADGRFFKVPKVIER